MIENCFGLMAVKWRVLLTTIATRPETCDHIVKAVCALHNCVIDEAPRGDAHPSAMADDGDDDNGRWRSEVATLPKRTSVVVVTTALRRATWTSVIHSLSILSRRVPCNGSDA